MKKENFKIILKEWKNYLKENLNIYSQVEKAKNLLNNNEKLLIDITKVDNTFFELKSYTVDVNNEVVNKVAHIEFEKLNSKKVIDNEGKERDCFIIFWTKYVKFNLGPLMYDILIEFVSKNNAIICSDREEVTDSAKNLWNNYLHNRVDVEKAQLDIENDNLDPDKFPNLTPQWEDDFYQGLSLIDMSKNNLENWFDSAFSKGYYKLNTPIIDILNSKSELEFFTYKENT